MKEKARNNRTLTELFIGIGIFTILCQTAFIISCPFTDVYKNHVFYYSSGLFIGALVATGCAFHMSRSLNVALSFDSDSASKIVRKDSILRYAVIAIILGVMMILDIASPLSAFLGIMGLKFGAYLNPVAKKILNGFIGEEEKKPLVSPEEQDRLYGKKDSDKEPGPEQNTDNN